MILGFYKAFTIKISPRTQDGNILLVAKLQLLQERAELQYRNLMYTVLGGVIHTNIQTETLLFQVSPQYDVNRYSKSFQKQRNLEK